MTLAARALCYVRVIYRGRMKPRAARTHDSVHVRAIRERHLHTHARMHARTRARQSNQAAVVSVAVVALTNPTTTRACKTTATATEKTRAGRPLEPHANKQSARNSTPSQSQLRIRLIQLSDAYCARRPPRAQLGASRVTSRVARVSCSTRVGRFRFFVVIVVVVQLGARTCLSPARTESPARARANYSRLRYFGGFRHCLAPNSSTFCGAKRERMSKCARR